MTEKMTKLEREKIITNNLPLVYKISGNYLKTYSLLDIDDLVQSGSIGLIKAVDNFDETKGVKFSTFAFHYINGYIKSFINNQKIIHIPNYIRPKVNKLNEIEYNNINLNTSTTEEEIINELNIDLEEYKIIKQANDINNTIISTNIQYDFNQAGSYELEDILSDNTENQYDLIIQKLSIEDITKNMNHIEKEIMYARFVDEKTYDEIAEERHTSRQNISRYVKRCIDRLKRKYTYSDVSEVF